MAIEEDTLKTLQAIQKILGNAFPAGRSADFAGGSPGNAQSRQRNEAASASKDAKAAKTIIMATTGSLEDLEQAASRSTATLGGFTSQTRRSSKGLSALNSSLGKTVAQFGFVRSELLRTNIAGSVSGLMKSVDDASKIFESLKIEDIDTSGLMNKITAIGQALEGQGGGGGLKQQINRSTRLFRELNRNLRTGQPRQRAAPGETPSNAGSVRGGGGSGDGGSGGGGGGRGRGRDREDDAPESKRIFGRAVKDDTHDLFGELKVAGSRALKGGVEVIDDMFQVVAARGLGAAGSLFSLYGSAIASGMELREYAKLLDENNGAVSRASSLDDFNKQLDVGRDALKKYGVFGPEATELAAAMNNSATLLGVPQAQLADATRGQIGVFDQLRKTTGLTAEAFTELVREMRDNEVIQRELIGLAPAERAQRQTELLQMSSWGKSLGLSEQAQRSLTQAIIDQRRSTVKERFQARGRITQAFALAGLSADDAEEARQLTNKRNKTTEESQRLVELFGQYNERSEAAKQSGNDGLANQFESMDEFLGQTINKPLLDAANAVKLAADSGPQQNTSQGQVLGEINQKLGVAITWLEGMAKNPLGLAAAGAVTAALTYFAGRAFATIVGSQIASVIGAKLGPGVGGGPNSSGDFVGPPTPDGLGNGAKKVGRLGRLARLGGKALPYVGAAIGVASAASDYFNADETAKAGDGDVGRVKGEAVGTAIGTAAGGAIGAFLGSIVPGFGTAIGGIVGSMLGGWAGKIFGGWTGAENASEKQAREMKNNTAELIKINRARAGASVVSSTDLGSLTSNIQKTAQAFAAPTDDEVNRYALSKMTPEQRKQKQLDDAAKATAADAQASNTASYYDPSGTLPEWAQTAPGTSTTAKSAVSAITSAAPVVAQAPAITAIPSVMSRAAVIPPTVNTASDSTNPTPTAPTTVPGIPTSNGAATSAESILAQILAVLQQTMAVETDQTGLIGQLVRTATSSRLPDNQWLGQQVLKG